ncbi:hypothetical protein RFI_06669 [Reticulomyxa filosa]|uniref:Uncharacterized protein n=1 Tax=Reticulomyxa filosa TaxID=46433 RepID=X6NX41_RETFI|nr:hypothetical protein RFI_06669 [Reticulomyxa filosa]|eukprot:ETO30448.1 hypothetical protein RFI_06669 [Reticulomyxa filosa]
MNPMEETLRKDVAPLSNEGPSQPNTSVSPRKIEEHLVSGTRHTRRKSATELRRLSHRSKEAEEEETDELRQLLELKQYHEYFRDFLTIWKNTLAGKSLQLTAEIIECCNDQKENNEPLIDSDGNPTTKEEFAKQVMFWLSGCVARINEPHQLIYTLHIINMLPLQFILRDFEKLQKVGINGNRLDKILKSILVHLREHKLFDPKINEMYNDICFQLLTFFNVMLLSSTFFALC